MPQVLEYFDATMAFGWTRPSILVSRSALVAIGTTKTTEAAITVQLDTDSKTMSVSQELYATKDNT